MAAGDIPETDEQLYRSIDRRTARIVTVRAVVEQSRGSYTDLGEVTYRVRSTTEDGARKTAIKRQLATIERQYPDAIGWEVTVVEA